MSNTTDAIRIQYGDKHYIPTGREVAVVMNTESYLVRFHPKYFRILRLLLSAGFCLLISIGCASHDDLLSLRLSLRTTNATVVEHTNALEALRREVISSENEQQIDPDGKESQPPKSQPETPTAVRLFVTHAPFNCPPCDALDRDVESGELKGFEVIKSTDFEGLKSYPAIRFEHTISATGWAVKYGWSAEQLAWLRENLLPAVVKKSVMTKSMSHSEMKALHDSLHGGGSWSWPGDLAKHLATAHGVETNGMDQANAQNPVTGKQYAVRSVSRGIFGRVRSRNSYRQSCPAGGCP